MSFDPSPDDMLELFGEEFVVQPHPAALWMAYAQEGGRATIFQIRDRSGWDFALKVFKPTFRDPRQPQIAKYLADYKELPGLRAAHRRVVVAGQGCVPPALDQAVVMPWIDGMTWFDVLKRTKTEAEHIKLEAAIHLCQRFLDVLRSLERRGAAHTDIAAGNVVIDLITLDVQLVDLEELFGRDFPPPLKVTGRTPGYTREGLTGGRGFWGADGDRFAGAILAAEILALSDPALARMSCGDCFFDPATIGAPDAPQFRAVMGYLRGLAPGLAELFARTWTAATLADCAPIAEWASNLDALTRRIRWTDGELFVRSAEPQVATQPSGEPADEDPDVRRRTIVWVPLEVAPPRSPVLVLSSEPPRPQLFSTWGNVLLFLLFVASICAAVIATVVRY